MIVVSPLQLKYSIVEQWSTAGKEKKTDWSNVIVRTDFSMFIWIKPTKVYFELEKLDKK